MTCALLKTQTPFTTPEELPGQNPNLPEPPADDPGRDLPDIRDPGQQPPMRAPNGVFKQARLRIVS